MFSRLFRRLEELTAINPSVILAVSTLLALTYYCWGVDSWRFAMVGDEWQFYQFAVTIAQKHYLFNPFSFHDGVYGQNSVVSSMYQAVVTDFFRSTNFGWRFSNIILIVPITIFFYKWLKESFDREIALLSTLLLQCSFYLANFFKVGKNMPQALALLVACFYSASQCAQKPSRKNLFILGVLLGVSFYIYIGPLFPGFIWPFFLPFLRAKRSREAFTKGLFLFIPYFLLILPGLLQLAANSGPATATVLHHEFTDNVQIAKNMYHMFLIFYKDYDTLNLHYVSGPNLDVVTRSLALCGSLISLLQVHKSKYRVLLLSYISAGLLIGASIPYTGIPATRGIFLIPFGAALAGIGLSAVLSSVQVHILVRRAFITVLLAGVFAFNFYISQIRVFEEVGYTGSALIIRSLQEAKESKRGSIVLVISPKLRINDYVWMYPSMQQAYNLQSVSYKVIRPSKLSCASVAHTNIYLLDYDTQAVDVLHKLNCAGADGITPTILSPKIPWF